MLSAAAHGWELEVLPEIGGAIGLLRHHGRDLLRPAPADATDPLQTGSFPLIPYVNRIAQGRIRFGGREWRLPANFGDHPHTLHGIGWQRRWRPLSATPDRIELVLEHSGGNGWPWPFRARQWMELHPRRFETGLSIVNLADERAPAGLGFHPYFLRHADSRLTALFDSAWAVDENGLPVRSVPAASFGNWEAGDTITQPGLVDNPYSGWDGSARISGGGMEVRMVAIGAPAFQIYIPPGADFFCAEPATDLPDAINRNEMRLLSPGEEMAITMRLEIV